jgi:phenylacetate-CoA ligase
MSAYSSVFGKALFPLYETHLRRRPTLRYLAELERSEWYSPDRLHELQSAALRRLIQHVHAHVPYYRDLMHQAGLGPDAIRSPDQLSQLPLLTREQARHSSQERTSLAIHTPDVRKSTSGTSGAPLAFGYDRDSEYRRQAMRLRGYGWAGYRPGDRMLHYWGSLAAQYKPPLKQRVKLAVDHFIRRDHYVDCATALGPAELERAVAEIRKFKPKIMTCYARAGAALARFIVEQGLRDWDDIPVICGAERLFPEDRPYIDAAFGSAFETYGSREVMLMAAECPAHAGMHLSMEHLIVEVVVREGDHERPAQPGELGEIAVTDLYNLGQPFIRYLNGDLGMLSAPEPCACGRSLPRLQAVEGRTTDTLRDADGRPVNGLFFNVMFSVLGDQVRSFQVVQRRDRSIDVRLVPTSRFDSSLLGTIRHNITHRFPGLEVRADLVPDIPAQANGKRRPVVVE